MVASVALRSSANFKGFSIAEAVIFSDMKLAANEAQYADWISLLVRPSAFRSSMSPAAAAEERIAIEAF